MISWILGQGSDGLAVVVESVYHLLRAEADHLHMATTANEQPPACTLYDQLGAIEDSNSPLVARK